MLKRLFIKNYTQTDRPEVRTAYGVTAGIFGIITNIVLCAIKMFIGIVSASITVVADAVNNLTDAC
ncbi:MAG: cation-efflux pump, partial [Clostridia bacterium]|nr:cation-efflux pump [Clostridia bacterium]